MWRGFSIRDATDNKSSLDDVMRALYPGFYQKHKGFGTADLLGLFREFGMPDVDGFYQRYVNGREPLPYESVFAKAGIAVTRKTTSVPDRKSTRLNSSHSQISYAVFCLKK